MAEEVQSNIRIGIDTSQALSSLKLLQSQISTFHTQMAKSGAASAAASAGMQQNLMNSINATGKFQASMVGVKTSTEAFTHALQNNKLSMGEYFRYAGGASKSFGKLFASEFATINKVARERVKDLQSQYITMGRNANGALQAIKVRPLALDMNNLATKTALAAQKQQILNQLLKQGSTNLLNWGKNTQWAGRQLMVGFTVPLLMLGGAAAKAYMALETASINLKRVYGDLNTSEKEIAKITQNVKDLGIEFTKYGIKVGDTMALAAKVAAMGKTGNDLLVQVRETSRMAALGGTTQDEALNATISLTNAFGISAKDLATNVDFLNYTQNQTVLSLEDMTVAIPKAGPIVKQLGGDVKDLTFFLTAMKEGGINASEGANAIKSGLAAIINPTKKASEMLAGYGINLRGIVDADKGNIRKTVVDFAQALDKLDPLNRARAIEQMFGKFQFARISTLLQNINRVDSQASKVMEISQKSQAELAILSERELKKVSDSPMYKFKAMVEQLKTTIIPLGEQFLKALLPIMKFFKDVFSNFNKMDDGMKSLITNITIGVAGFGPIILMAVGLFANGIANIIKGFATVKAFLNNLGKSNLALGEQTAFMTQEQINQAAASSSLDQAHSKLIQTFTSEAEAVGLLQSAYIKATEAQMAFSGAAAMRGPAMAARKLATGGIVRGPGTGTSDSIPAMISNGEAVIPARSVARHPDLVNSLVAGSLPGFAFGRGTPLSFAGKTYEGLIVSQRSEAALERLLTRFGTNVEAIDRELTKLQAGLSEENNTISLSAKKFKQMLTEAGIRQTQTSHSNGMVFAHGMAPRDLSATEIARISANPETSAGTRARLAAASRVTGLSNYGFILPEDANKGRMSPSTLASQFRGPALATTMGPIADQYARTLGLSLKQALANPAIAQQMFADLQKFGDIVATEIGAITTQSVSDPQFYAALAAAETKLSGQVSGTLMAALNDSKVVTTLATFGGEINRGMDGVRNGLSSSLIKMFNQVEAELVSYRSQGTAAMVEKGRLIMSELMVALQSGMTSAEINAFGINSPSREEIYVAEQRVAGFEVGMKDAIIQEEALGAQLGTQTGSSFFRGISRASAASRGSFASGLENKVAASAFARGDTSGLLIQDKLLRAVNAARIAENERIAQAAILIRERDMLESAENAKLGNRFRALMSNIGSTLSSAGSRIRGVFSSMWAGITASSRINATQLEQVNNEVLAAEIKLRMARKYGETEAIALAEAELEQALAAQAAVTGEKKLSAFRKLSGSGMGGRMGAGMALSMMPMAMTMSGNKQMSDIGNQLMMPAMGASMALMMIPGPVGIVVAGLIGLASVVGMAVDAHNKSNIAAYDFGKSLSVSNDKLVEFSKVTKTVSATEERARASQDRVAGLSTKAAGNFGTQFLSSSIGKQFISDAYTQRNAGANGTQISQNITSQLGYQIAQGTITSDQAKSIAQSIGAKLKDQSITATITGELNKLFGPNGENLMENPLKIMVDLQQRQRATTKEIIDTTKYTQKEANTKNTSSDTIMGNIGMFLGMDTGGANVKKGQIKSDQYDQAKGAAQAQLQQYSLAQGSLDVINAQYDKQLKLAKTTKEIATIEGQRKSALRDQKIQNETIYQEAIAYKETLTNSGINYNQDVFKTSIEQQFKNSPELEKAKQLADSVNNLKDKTLQTRLQFQFSSGELDTTTLTNILQAEQSDKKFSLNYNAAIKLLGDAKTIELIQSISAAGGNATTVAAEISLAISDPDNVEGRLSAIKQITDLKSLGITIDINSTSGQNAIAKYASDLATLKGLAGSGPITIDMIQKVTGNKLVSDAIWNNKQFQELPQNQQLAYVAEYQAILSMKGKDPKVDGPLAAGFSQYLTTNPKATFEDYASYLTGNIVKNDNSGTTGGTGDGTTPSGSGNKPTDLLGDTNKAINDSKAKLFMQRRGWNAGFADMLSSADAQTQKVYAKIDKNGKVVLTSAGQKLKVAYDKKILSEFITKQDEVNRSFQNEMTTRDGLAEAGLSQADAIKYAADADVQAAYASALAIKNDKLRTQAIKDIISALKTKSDVENKTNKQKLFDDQSKEIDQLNSQKIAYDMLVKGGMSVVAAREAVADATRAEIIANITNNDELTKYIELQKQIAVLTETNKDPNQVIIDNAQKNIDVLQAQATTYQDALSLLQKQEDAINKKYDDRITALDKIQAANEAIAAQQRGQLDLADALSKGDIAAAAKAAQDMRNQSQKDSFDYQKKLLESGRQAEVNALSMLVNGQTMTMKQLTDKISSLETEILKIKFNTIDPAAQALANQAQAGIINTTKIPQIPWSVQNAALIAAAKAESASPNFGGQGIAGPATRQLLRSGGGMVPKYFANGDLAVGTDTIPAMLTPGEFIMTKYAVKNFGVDNLRSINNGTYNGDSMYNYNLSVNMSGSNLNPDDVARTVMSQIKQIDSQRLRGNRL